MGGCLRPQDSLWDGAHDARLTGDVVGEILGGKVDRADWSGVPDDPQTGARPRHNSSAPYRDVFKRKLIMAQMLHLGNSHKKLAQSAFQ